MSETGTSTNGTASGPRVHDIGPSGIVVVAVEADDVRLRGVDGTEVRVVSPADGAGIETVAESGRFTVRLAGGPRDSFFGLRIGGHGFGIGSFVGHAGTVELDVPRNARVDVHTASGDIALRDVRGGAALKTASGDISLKRAGGAITVGTASGEVQVEAIEPIELEAKAVSGSVRARAPRFDRLAVETVSGDAELTGSFAAGERHLVSTASGDVEVALAGGLEVTARTVSGEVECTHPDRRSGDGRRQPLVIGDGAAQLTVRTLSGDVEVRAARIDPGAADASAPVTPAPASDAATMPVLEALARGEIDVAEAERRLAAGAAEEARHD